ncbi:MAG: MarR family transcriptional regulator [Rhizobiaceae bacterium]|nr:MarR family transcriptional regulator [Rhizobiaceae bacterium]
MHLLRERGYNYLSLAQLSVTRNLDDDGTRLTELARRAGMTKQSMGELVKQVEDLQLIERRRDPLDARARLICFTPSGFDWLEAFHQSLMIAEAEMSAEIGPEAVSFINHALGKYSDDWFDPH